jgi:hypothetical protein
MTGILFSVRYRICLRESYIILTILMEKNPLALVTHCSKFASKHILYEIMYHRDKFTIPDHNSTYIAVVAR